MPSPKTETSELAVAFGILGTEPSERYSPAEIERRFEGTLSPEKYERFLKEYRNGAALYGRLYEVGRLIAVRHAPLAQMSSLRWTGPYQQAATTSVAKDLLVANTPVSIKNESNVVANLSPANMMINLPQGKTPTTHEENWYLTSDSGRFQDLYVLVRGMNGSLDDLPSDIQSFEQQASLSDRRRIQSVLRNIPKLMRETFDVCYVKLCHSVAQRSAKTFNDNLAHSMITRSRRGVLENLARWFFRLNAMQYVLCGIDRGENFVVVVPELTRWLREWELEGVQATPDLTRGQSVVDFKISCRRKVDKMIHEAPYHAEIRWSHGRFSGAVESKLYKEFAWRELPFFPDL